MPLQHTARLWPHRAPGEGHFIALLRRTATPRVPRAPRRRARRQSVPKSLRAAWQAFAHDHFGGDIAHRHQLVAQGDRLYAVLLDTLPFDGLRVVQTGWQLGAAHRGRFEPSHHLALALRRAELEGRGRVTLPLLDHVPDDERLARYRQGHPLDAPGADGWVLITVSGFPIGWGYRAQGVVKNRYPKGLRTF